MIDTTELMRVIEEIAPPYLVAEWDNSGIQIEPAKREIGRILVALDITMDVVREAKAGGYDLIVVHHPLFFGGKASPGERNILQSNATGRYIWRLLADPPAPVGVYAAHTPFDAAEGGLSDELQSILGLTPWDERLHPDNALKFSDIAPYARTGRFSEVVDLAGAVSRVRAALGTGADIRVSGDPARSVLKVMTVCGGGGDAVPLAVKTRCDLLISGDIRHHEWRLAEAEGLAIIDAGHYYTERPFATLFAERLRNALGPAAEKITINISSKIRQPYASPKG